MNTRKINGYTIYHAFIAGYLFISRNREYINSINYFPVHDGDTGSNMIGTFKNIAERISGKPSFSQVWNSIADFSLEGARGNSGLILSQFFNSIAEQSQEKREIEIKEFAQIAEKAALNAYDALDNPQEGTILTIMKVWSKALYDDNETDESIWPLLNRALAKTKEALENTKEQLAVLKENDVVDAGAWGFVCFLEGIQRMETEGLPSFHKRQYLHKGEFFPQDIHHEVLHGKSQKITFRYCTEFLLEDVLMTADQIKKVIKKWGDSMIVSKGRKRFRIHIHSNFPDQVMKTLRDAGTLVQQKVDDMVRQEQVVSQRIGSVAVVTDSIADIPQYLLDQYQIHRINLKLIWDEEEYLDRLTLTPDDFYDMQSKRRTFPSSSLPTLIQVETLFLSLLEHYESIIVLPVAKALSGTWNQMNLAAEKINAGGHRITVMDTCLNSAAQGLLVSRIAKAAAEGKSLSELEQMTKDLIGRIKIYVSVKTFRFMVKGGRVSPLKGLVAKMLNLKPIVSLDEAGRGIAFDKSFSAKGLLRKIAHLLEETLSKKGLEEYAVVHAASLDRAHEFSALAEEITGMAPAYITDISPIVGMHSGKGAVAIGVIESSQ